MRLFCGLSGCCTYFGLGRFAWLGSVARAQSALSEFSMLLPEMPLHDPFILAYAPTKTYYLYTSNVASSDACAAHWDDGLYE